MMSLVQKDQGQNLIIQPSDYLCVVSARCIGRSVLGCTKVLLRKVTVKFPVLHQRERIQSEDMESAPRTSPMRHQYQNIVTCKA